MNKVGNEFF